MDKIIFISKTKESWEKNGKFDPPFLEVSKQDHEILFDIGTRDEINNLKSECISLSGVDAQRLGSWLLGLDLIPLKE